MQVSHITAVLIATTIGAASLAAQAPELKWGAAPAVFPAGAKMAVLQGDPGKAGLFTVRLDFPVGYTIAAHFHPTDEYITVIAGSFDVGMGDKFDSAHMMTLPASGFVTAGARQNHFARAKSHAVVQITSMGPFAMTYVNPADDPTHKAAAKK